MPLEIVKSETSECFNLPCVGRNAFIREYSVDFYFILAYVRIVK